MNEHGYIRALHKGLPARLYQWKINVRFANGIPDAYYSGDLADLWVEYKWVSPAPVRALTPLLRPLQKQWLTDRHHEGRQVAVIIGTPSGGIFLPDLEWDRTIRIGATPPWLKYPSIREQIISRTCLSTAPKGNQSPKVS